MRCPRCLDDYEPDVATCATCGSPLVAPGAAAGPVVDARLGRFHPAVADRVVQLLAHRRIAHVRIERDDDVEVLVDRAWRDDLRAELALTWAQIVHALPAEQTVTVLGLGGASPGWYDAPQGGWVDRAGRLVVDDAERSKDGEVRLAGPALTVIGAVLLLMGWYVGADAVVVLAGLALTVFGVLLPR